MGEKYILNADMEGLDTRDYFTLGELVGSGGQAKVYRVSVHDKDFAFKVFFEAGHLAVEKETL